MKELFTIQQKLKVPKTNEAKNNGRTMYKYRSCEQILELVKPILSAEKCTLTISDTMVAEGGRFYIVATATITNEAGDSVSTSAFAREPERMNAMNEAQVTGACSSYARKYALNGLFAIDDTDEADAIMAQASTAHTKEDWRLDFAQARTENEVRAVWYRYPYMQHNQDFINEANRRRNIILSNNGTKDA